MNFLNDLIEKNLNKYGEKTYVSERKDNNWECILYKDFISMVKNIATTLLNLNMSGKKIAILSDNSAKYIACDLAVMSYVGTIVNINTFINENTLRVIVNKVHPDLFVYSSKYKDLLDDLNIANKYDIDTLCSCNSNLNYDLSTSYLDESKCIKTLFTSGTTGDPKAVMLSLKNIKSCIGNFENRLKFCDSDIFYLFLPMCHAYGGIYNALYSFMYGASIYLCGDKKKMFDEILTINPTIVCCVPIIFERIFEKYGENIKSAFGKNIRCLFCAGADFNFGLKKLFKSNFNLIEAYGLSETTSVISEEYLNEKIDKSVGTIYENMTVKIIDADSDGYGEIAVKGDNVFIGYDGDMDIYKKCFTTDGFFKTGDIGKICGNRIFFKNRKNSNNKLANGTFKNRII